VAKILFVSTSTTIGGAEKTLVTLATRINHQNTEISGVVSIKTEGTYARLLRENNIPVWSFDRTCGQFSDVKHLAQIIDREKPDIVHAFMYQAIQIARLAKSFTRAPFRLISSPRVNYRTRSRLSLLLDLGLKHRDDLVITESEASRRFLIEKLCYSPDVVMTIHNGIDPTHRTVTHEERVKIRAGINLGPGDILIGAMGRLDTQKGFDVLIDALSLLKKYPLSCAILGEGPERPRLEQLIADHHLQKNVHLIGEVEQPDAWLSAFDVYCLPSRWEGLPNALLEAMRRGLPIIASDVDGVPEVITSGTDGLLVAPENVEGFADALKTLANDPPLREKLSSNAKTTVAERYSLVRMIKDYEHIYASSSPTTHVRNLS
jgi:glycosyltransferase involved in cell wall biosynthesis